MTPLTESSAGTLISEDRGPCGPVCGGTEARAAGASHFFFTCLEWLGIALGVLFMGDAADPRLEDDDYFADRSESQRDEVDEIYEQSEIGGGE